MIQTDFSPSTPLLNNLYEGEEFGNFMFRPIKWIRQTDEYEIVRKVVAVVVTILLCASVLGLTIVIPGAIEWDRQCNAEATLSNGFSDSTVPLANLISVSLANFDNQTVQGQVNGIYITTNELNLDAADVMLTTCPLREEQTIHIGCATWHNFDIMCKRKSDYGLIMDFNPKNADFIKKTVEIIGLSESREVFTTNIIAYLNSLQGIERNLFFHNDQQGLLPTDRVENELNREGSWLENEENFAFIKDLVSKQRIIAITEDITNHNKFSEIRGFLDSNSIGIDTVYLSNICNFMKTDESKESYTKSITQLVNKDTILISCPKIRRSGSSETVILHQNPILGSHILGEGFNSLQLFELENPTFEIRSVYLGSEAQRNNTSTKEIRVKHHSLDV